ncbi:hypothetical protein AMECASPLE_014383, partial [Ameca splendens]
MRPRLLDSWCTGVVSAEGLELVTESRTLNTEPFPHKYKVTASKTGLHPVKWIKKKKVKVNLQALLYRYAYITSTQYIRMCGGPLRLFARCRSMGIECGQGGLRIDRGPLERCVYWDVEAREGAEDASG